MNSNLDYLFARPLDEYSRQILSLEKPASSNDCETLNELTTNILKSETEEEAFHSLNKIKNRLTRVQHKIARSNDDSEPLEKTQSLYASIISMIEADISAAFDKIPDNKKLDKFLSFTDLEKGEVVKNPEHHHKIETFIADFDQNKIVDEKKGENLFLSLLESQNPSIRELGRICLDQGVDVNFENKLGQNALFYVAKNGDSKLFDLLERRGVLLNKKDKKGKLFFEYAKSPQILSKVFEHPDIVLSSEDEGGTILLKLTDQINQLSDSGIKEMNLKIAAFINQLDKSALLYHGKTWFKELTSKINHEEEWIGILEGDITLYRELVKNGILPKLEDPDQCAALNSIIREFPLQDHDFLLALFHQNIIPFVAIESNRRFVSFPYYLIEQLEEGSDIVRAKFNDETLQTFNQYACLLRHYPGMRYPNQLDVFKQLNTLADQLIENKFPHIQQLHETLQASHYERLNRFEDLIKIGQENLKLFEEKVKQLSKEDQTALKELTRKRKEIALWGAIEDYDYLRGRTKLVANIFLEKSLYASKELYNSNTAEWTTFAIARVIENALNRVGAVPEGTVSAEVEEKVAQYLKGTFLPLIQRCGFLVNEYVKRREYMREYGERPFGEKLSDDISLLKPKESILIPWGSYMHWTGLLIERNDEKTANMTLYNTGAGIRKHHYRFGNTHRFQTSFTIKNVPIENFQNAENMEKLHDLRSSSNPADNYKYLVEELGKGGEIEPPSEYSEDYESAQIGGSCAYQFILAMLRHQLLHMEGVGTKEERMGLYKLVKAHLFHAYAKDEITDLDQEIQEVCKSKLDKLVSDQHLAEICSNDDTFNQAYAELSDYLGGRGKADALTIPTTVLERYAYLRHISNQIIEKWLEDPPSLQNADLDSEGLRFALDKYRHQKNKLDGYLELIEKYFKSENSTKSSGKLLELILNSPFPMQGVNWIQDHISEEDIIEVGDGLKKEHVGFKMQAFGETIYKLASFEEGEYYIELLKEKYSDSPKALAFIDYLMKRLQSQSKSSTALDK